MMETTALRGMRGHLEKSAARIPASVLRALETSVHNGPLHGAALGAGAGALIGAASGEEGNRASSAFRGAIRGAAIGGVTGAVGQAAHDRRLLSPSIGAGEALRGGIADVARVPVRFAKRQLHGFTGAYADRPGEIGLRSTATAHGDIDKLRRRLEHRVRSASPEERTRLVKEFEGHRNNLLADGLRGDAALAAGVTNMPGIVRGLRHDPKNTLKALWRESTGGSRRGTALSVGVPLVLSAPDIARGDERDVGGRSMRQKVVGLGTNLAGGVVTSGLPAVPQLVGGVAFDELGQRITRSRRRVPQNEVR